MWAAMEAIARSGEAEVTAVTEADFAAALAAQKEAMRWITA